MRKGYYPYSYMDSYTKFADKSLPRFGTDWTNVLSGRDDVTDKMLLCCS